VAREVEKRLAMGDLGMLKEKCPTVAQYGREWVMSPLNKWEDSTRSVYNSILERFIIPRLGNRQVDDIKLIDVKRFLESVHNLSPARKQTILAVLSGILNGAREDGIIDFNPCQNTGKYIGNGTQIEINPYTPTEVQTFLERASELEFETYTFYLMAVRTGLRVGELLALEWGDIDFENRFVEISRAMSTQNGQVGLPKNKRKRKVDLSHATVEALRKLQGRDKVTSIHGRVFPNLRYWQVRRVLKKIAPRPMRLHDLRHTYATLRIAKGDNILDVSKQLGHHKVAFTLDKYAHWMPGEHKSQVDELDTLHLSAPYTHPQAKKRNLEPSNVHG
jgi:integrase